MVEVDGLMIDTLKVCHHLIYTEYGKMLTAIYGLLCSKAV